MATSWTFIDNPTTITVTRAVDMFGGTIHTNIFICNKQLIKLSSSEPLLFFLYSKPDNLKYHQFDVDYNLVSSPVSVSAADLQSQVQAMLDNMSGIIIFTITAADFSGSNYTDARLIGKTPVTDFSVFSNDGSGTLQKEDPGIGYTFNSGTGVLTMPAGNYQIEIYG